MTCQSSLSNTSKLAPHSSIQTVDAPRYKDTSEASNIVKENLVRRPATTIKIEDDDNSFPAKLVGSPRCLSSSGHREKSMDS